MKIHVNGEPHEVADDSRVADVLVLVGRGSATHGIAVAVNGKVVPRGAWPDTSLSDDDNVEVLQAIGGG